MTAETVLTNARIVLADEIVEGSLLLRDGVIADIDAGAGRTGEDMGGDYIIPGLVELHTDHLEGHYAPRPKVRWNPIAAVLAHDAQVATAGITTVLDALRVGMDEDADLTSDDIRKLADAIEDSVAQDRLRADHFLHLRCEVSAPDCLQAFANFDEDDRVKLASLMDHAPGQRQFVNLETYAYYYQRKLKLTDRDFKLFCEKRMGESAHNSAPNRRAIAAACHERGIVLASHDDATSGHVDEAIEQGVRVAEFPTTEEAARASKAAGLGVLMGAPNVMRGASHSGNVSARTLASDGLLDILSSDYIPFSLIQSAFFLGDMVEGISLPQAVAMVSKNPAEAVGLNDRGMIEQGRRADLVRVRVDDHVPVVRTVWRQGRRVADASALPSVSAAESFDRQVFVAVVGPSGAGSDTVIGYAWPSSPTRRGRSSSAASSPVRAMRRARITTRWLTRPLSSRADGALPFRGRRMAATASRPMSTGRSMGASPWPTYRAPSSRRAALANLAIVEITASPDVLAERLAMRGRESRGEVLARLARSANVTLTGAGVTSIDNSGPREVAGERFAEILRKAMAFSDMSGLI